MTSVPQPWASGSLEPLERIARIVADLPHDLLGFGAMTAVAGDAAITASAESDLHEDFSNIAGQLEAIHVALTGLRRAYLARQQVQWGIGNETRGLRVNLTGETPLAGWLNLGAHRSGMISNLLWPLPLPDGCARRVLFAMAIEHFPLQRVPGILREIHRVLEPGGIVRIITQDTERYATAYVEHDVVFFKAQERYWDMPSKPGPLLHHVLAWSGTSRRPDDFFDHKYGYDFASLAALLYGVGFSSVERSDFMASKYQDLRVDTNSADADAHFGDRMYAMFVEAGR